MQLIWLITVATGTQMMDSNRRREGVRHSGANVGVSKPTGAPALRPEVGAKFMTPMINVHKGWSLKIAEI